MSIADEMSEHAFITQLIIQIRKRVRVTSPKLHLRQVVACLILAGVLDLFHFKSSSTRSPV